MVGGGGGGGMWQMQILVLEHGVLLLPDWKP